MQRMGVEAPMSTIEKAWVKGMISPDNGLELNWSVSSIQWSEREQIEP